MNDLCSLCKEKSPVLFETRDLNRRVSDKVFTYRRCPRCGLVFLSDCPSDLSVYYEEDYYAIPSIKKIARIAKIEKYQIEMVKRFFRTGRLLEIGPGFGAFAYQAKRSGFEVTVIEMDQRTCRHLSETIGVTVIQSAKPHEAIRELRSFDVIALWHVIEHLPEAWLFLRDAVRHLSPRGIVLIATPNPEAFQFRLMKSEWPHVDAPRHLHLIPSNALRRELEKAGLEQVFLTSSDQGAIGWNRFGWQRFLMNRFSNKFLHSLCFLLGYAVGVPFTSFERRDLQGSAYTAIFQKNNEE